MVLECEMRLYNTATSETTAENAKRADPHVNPGSSMAWLGRIVRMCVR